MSNSNLSRTESQVAPRLGYSEYGISRARYIELRNGCAEGKYSPETLQEACQGFEFVMPWIILSVTKSRSYDLIEFSTKLGRIPVGRSDFYGFRRKFYHNLDCLLKNGQGDLPMKERVMQMNSRQKGTRGERELSHILQEYGYNCRRGQQYSGANGDADVVGLPGIHIECKRVERLNLSEAMKQAVKDADAAEVPETPVVFHRKNQEGWLVTMKLEDFMKLYKTGGKEIEK